MLIGRQREAQTIKEAIDDDRSHFIAIYGRRRIGKTYLVKELCGNRFTFHHAGVFEGSLSDQLFAFDASLKEAGFTSDAPSRSWAEAFEKLKDLIRRSTEARKIIFLDELSWMDTPKSNFIMALENFWNGWASMRNDMILIVCASATSWMLSKIVHNKGGLYNRLTERIELGQFCLAECEEYVAARRIALGREHILRYYMIFGGVPYYWSLLRKGESEAQCVDRLLFGPEAELKDEFFYLYAAVFKHPECYLKIIGALAKSKSGLTREDIIEKTGLVNSGDLTAKLEDLESCGFIRKYSAFGMKKKGAVYQLIDNFTLFYYRFLQGGPSDEHFWSHQINTPAINTWSGLAFERICLLHVPQIKQKLGIAGVLTEVNSWYCSADADEGIFGSQIDMLIVRRDQVINLCEMKYSGTEYSYTGKDDRSMQNKISDLRRLTKTKFAIHPTLITTYGLVNNMYSANIQSLVTMEDLFAGKQI